MSTKPKHIIVSENTGSITGVIVSALLLSVAVFQVSIWLPVIISILAIFLLVWIIRRKRKLILFDEHFRITWSPSGQSTAELPYSAITEVRLTYGNRGARELKISYTDSQPGTVRFSFQHYVPESALKFLKEKGVSVEADRQA